MSTDIEQRLAAMLGARAAEVGSTLDPQTLRSLAASNTRSTRRTVLQSLAAAAAVAAIALLPQAFTHPDRHHTPQPQQPGRPVPTTLRSTTAPSPSRSHVRTTAPTPAPSSAPTTPRRPPPRPTMSGTTVANPARTSPPPPRRSTAQSATSTSGSGSGSPAPSHASPSATPTTR